MRHPRKTELKRIPFMKVKRIIVSYMAGIIMAFLLVLADRIQYVPGFSEIAEYAWVPGALVASIFFPAGMHTGIGTSFYVPLAWFFNSCFYGGIAYGILGCFLARRVPRANSRDQIQS
jgi:hypothetical protein